MGIVRVQSARTRIVYTSNNNIYLDVILNISTPTDPSMGCSESEACFRPEAALTICGYYDGGICFTLATVTNSGSGLDWSLESPLYVLFLSCLHRV
jgi:hypothetical protein